jgi:hypothetical protein
VRNPVDRGRQARGPTQLKPKDDENGDILKIHRDQRDVIEPKKPVVLL